MLETRDAFCSYKRSLNPKFIAKTHGMPWRWPHAYQHSQDQGEKGQTLENISLKIYLCILTNSTRLLWTREKCLISLFHSFISCQQTALLDIADPATMIMDVHPTNKGKRRKGHRWAASDDLLTRGRRELGRNDTRSRVMAISIFMYQETDGNIPTFDWIFLSISWACDQIAAYLQRPSVNNFSERCDPIWLEIYQAPTLNTFMVPRFYLIWMEM